MKAEVRDTFPSNKPHQSSWDQAAAKRIRFLQNLSSTETFMLLGGGEGNQKTNQTTKPWPHKLWKLCCGSRQMSTCVIASSGLCSLPSYARNALFLWHGGAESIDSCGQYEFNILCNTILTQDLSLVPRWAKWMEDVLRNDMNSACSCRTKTLIWSPVSQSTTLNPLCFLRRLFLNEAWIGAWLHLFPWLQSKISWGCCLLNDRGGRCSVIIALLTAVGADFSIAPQLHLKWQVTAGFIHLPLRSSPVLASSKGTA